jgi:dTDP-4-amino-4,6-dideoxygalactose transaminase
MDKIIPISKPFSDRNDFETVSKPVKSAWVVQGKYVREFENKFRKFTGSEYTVIVSCFSAVNSGMYEINTIKYFQNLNKISL